MAWLRTNAATAGRAIWRTWSGENAALDKYVHPDWDDEPEVNGYVHALVTFVGTGIATLKFGRYTAAVGQAEVAWTQHKLADILKTGDICYVKVLSLGANGAAHVSLEQDSGAQGALLAIDNATGGIKAMVGGRDFNESKFDRATQAMRQVGSSFKPYVYTTVIDGGASPTTQFSTSRSASRTHPALTRRTTTTKSLRASSPCAVHWRSPAISRH